MVDVLQYKQHLKAPQRLEKQAMSNDDMLSTQHRDLNWSPTLNKTRDPIIIPLFTKKAFWPLQDVLQLQNKVQLNNPSPLSLSFSLFRPPFFDSPLSQCLLQITIANPLNLCTKSPSSRLSRTSLTLAAADEHPEEMDECKHHGFGLQEICFQLL